jgi:hypothetical protein
MIAALYTIEGQADEAGRIAHTTPSAEEYHG